MTGQFCCNGHYHQKQVPTIRDGERERECYFFCSCIPKRDSGTQATGRPPTIDEALISFTDFTGLISCQVADQTGPNLPGFSFACD